MITFHQAFALQLLNTFGANTVDELMVEQTIFKPRNLRQVISALEKKGMVSRGRGKMVFRQGPRPVEWSITDHGIAELANWRANVLPLFMTTNNVTTAVLAATKTRAQPRTPEYQADKSPPVTVRKCLTVRECLKCSESFPSSGSGNRICTKCKNETREHNLSRKQKQSPTKVLR